MTARCRALIAAALAVIGLGCATVVETPIRLDPVEAEEWLVPWVQQEPVWLARRGHHCKACGLSHHLKLTVTVDGITTCWIPGNVGGLKPWQYTEDGRQVTFMRHRCCRCGRTCIVALMPVFDGVMTLWWFDAAGTRDAEAEKRFTRDYLVRDVYRFER